MALIWANTALLLSRINCIVCRKLYSLLNNIIHKINISCRHRNGNKAVLTSSVFGTCVHFATQRWFLQVSICDCQIGINKFNGVVGVVVP